MSIKQVVYNQMKALLEKEDLKLHLERNRLSAPEIKSLPVETIGVMETVRNYLSRATILLDIGAHKGLFSKVANLFFDFRKTICFEPNETLHDTIRENNPGKSIQLEKIALSDKVSATTFFLHNDDTMSSIIQSKSDVLKKEFPWDNPELIERIDVQTITLDAYTDRRDFRDDSFFLKLDTQGNELNILKAGINTLKQTEVCLVEHIFTSPYDSDYTFEDLVKFMAENGFQCKGALSIHKRPSRKISAVDFLFINKTMS